MYTQPAPAPSGSPVPGIIPEPVRVVDALGGNGGRISSQAVDGIADRSAAPWRRHAIANLLARLLSVIRGDKHGGDAGPPAWRATAPARAEVTRADVHTDVPAGGHPAGKLDPNRNDVSTAAAARRSAAVSPER